MSFHIKKLALCLISFCCLIGLGCTITMPKQPEKFTSPEHVREYISKVNEYLEYLEIINRFRWGRAIEVESTDQKCQPDWLKKWNKNNKIVQSSFD